jgi:hypothetical protein
VILVFVKSTDALTVHNETLVRFAFGVSKLNRLTPDPETLGAGVDGWSYPKALILLLFEQDPIKKE